MAYAIGLGWRDEESADPSRLRAAYPVKSLGVV
jgi:hypothetical protein